MNFYIVYCKSRKKVDKFMKINRIKKKLIIDIKSHREENNIIDDIYSEYFNLLIFSKIMLAIKSGKDIYYIPEFNKSFNIDKILNIKKNIQGGIKFNILIFFDDFINDKDIVNEVLNNLTEFDISQIIKDY